MLTEVHIIAVDQDITQGPPTSGAAGRLAATITLQVSADQAEKLAVSARLGRLSLAVRPVADPNQHMPAEPGVARVQPASPTSLFLMGVGPGRTTVIATSETGAPVGQYDVIVTPMQRAAPPPPQAARAGLNPASAREAQSSVRRLIPGARSVVIEATGGRLTMRGSVPNAMAAQQVEAIARGFVGDNATIVDEMIVLGSVQVNVRVRIAEISRVITRQLGFN